MRIKMLTSIATATWNAGPGQEVEVPDADARRLLQSGQAEPVKTQAETAALDGGTETTAGRTPASRRGK
jgi:hypothetical protein